VLVVRKRIDPRVNVRQPAGYARFRRPRKLRQISLEFRGIASPSAGAGALSGRRYAPVVNFDAGTIVAGLVVSSVGFVFFSYGRKMSRPPHIVIGLILMVYPYFIPGVILTFVIGALLCGLLYLATRMGY
jgi:hypothetical protein